MKPGPESLVRCQSHARLVPFFFYYLGIPPSHTRLQLLEKRHRFSAFVCGAMGKMETTGNSREHPPPPTLSLSLSFVSITGVPQLIAPSRFRLDGARNGGVKIKLFYRYTAPAATGTTKKNIQPTEVTKTLLTLLTPPEIRRSNSERSYVRAS